MKRKQWRIENRRTGSRRVPESETGRNFGHCWETVKVRARAALVIPPSQCLSINSGPMSMIPYLAPDTISEGAGSNALGGGRS